jgi:hypothetical protein
MVVEHYGTPSNEAILNDGSNFPRIAAPCAVHFR